MELRFYGATGTTTGSCHLLHSEGRTVLLDCGLFQGRREESWKKNRDFGFDPQGIQAVVQSHAHVDHSGKLPMLVRQGFAGRIHATPATRDLADILLHDSAKIALADAQFLNRQRWRLEREARRAPAPAQRGRRPSGGLPPPQGRRPSGGLPPPRGKNQPMVSSALLPAREIVPLYLEEDVHDTLPRFAKHEYGVWFEPVPGMRFRFRDAGHILGSAWVEGEIRERSGVTRLVFTGDYGRYHQPILRDPEPLSEAEVYISESTYGNRCHAPFVENESELSQAVQRLAARPKGRLLIPAFAVGRTQHILYELYKICRRRTCANVGIVVDSPLAQAATRIVMAHPECFDEEALAAFRAMQEDGSFRKRIRFTQSIEESKALNDDPRPLIVISASGMMESGRILHHLAWNVSNPATEILVVGFQAQHTLGRRLVDGASEVRIFGMLHKVRARVTNMLGFSAHADRDDLLAALGPHAGAARALFLIHGENDQRKPLAEELRRRGFARVECPENHRAWQA
jgi:metallo-beta-lactamase family protein